MWGGLLGRDVREVISEAVAFKQRPERSEGVRGAGAFQHVYTHRAAGKSSWQEMRSYRTEEGLIRSGLCRPWSGFLF